jgi:hypothetical protein
MLQVVALLAFEIDVEEGFVPARLHLARSDDWQSRAAKIFDQTQIGGEGKGFRRPVCAFGAPVVGDAPDLSFRIDDARTVDFQQLLLQKQRVEGDLGFVERSRRPCRLNVNHPELRPSRREVSPDQVGEALPQSDRATAAQKGRQTLGPQINLRGVLGGALATQESNHLSFQQSRVPRGRSQDANFPSQSGDDTIFVVDSKLRPRLFPIILRDRDGSEFTWIHDLVPSLPLTAVLKP